MRLHAMDKSEERRREIAIVTRLEQLAETEGKEYGPKLIRLPAAKMRRLMRTDEHYRSYGTLRYLLDEARSRFDSQPTVAREITSAVLAFVDHVDAPSTVHKIGLRGRARKEHASALEATGDLRRALQTARRAVTILGESAGLQFDQTRARLVEANICRNLGMTERALSIARECTAVFIDYGQNEYVRMARMCEGVVLFAQKNFMEALALFTTLIAQAEREGDKVTLARGLHNAAECARELGDLRAARDLYPRALKHFQELGLQSEINRVHWGQGLAFAAEGKTEYAASELFMARASYLRMGMNSAAGSCGLDIVRIRFESGKGVRELCSELVTTLSAAGLTQQAIEALAYLREQARQGTLSTTKIRAVRVYFNELSRQPALLFAHPREED